MQINFGNQISYFSIFLTSDDIFGNSPKYFLANSNFSSSTLYIVSIVINLFSELLNKNTFYSSEMSVYDKDKPDKE